MLSRFALASLQRTIARQRARITYLADGDANTKFFFLQACHRNRKNFIDKLKVDNSLLVQNEEMACAVFDHFCRILGGGGNQLCSVDLSELTIPSIQDEVLQAYQRDAN